MISDNLLHTIKHFVKSVKFSKENPLVLILDNRESHVAIEITHESEPNGVHLVTFPLHFNYRPQPLDA